MKALSTKKTRGNSLTERRVWVVGKLHFNCPDTWDLSTIPDEVWASEQGKRSRAKAPRATNVKLEPCKYCGESLTARERRRACKTCGRSQRKVI